MNVAVLTLTRDRLPYTQHCFATLKENAGCDYDHIVLDQGSTDGTAE
jgi:GT2 family glycosyltransferase